MISNCRPVVALGALLAFVLYLAGCATTPKIDWNSRVGVYTYDQAVLDLGPPDKMAKLTDGAIVAEWLVQRGRLYSSGSAFGYYGEPYGGGYGMYPGFLVTPQYIEQGPNTYLRLVFDPQGLLVSWTDFRQ